MASWVGDPARRLLEPRCLPYASWDLTDGNVEKFYGLRVGPLLLSFASYSNYLLRSEEDRDRLL